MKNGKYVIASMLDDWIAIYFINILVCRTTQFILLSTPEGQENGDVAMNDWQNVDKVNRQPLPLLPGTLKNEVGLEKQLNKLYPKLPSFQKNEEGLTKQFSKVISWVSILLYIKNYIHEINEKNFELKNVYHVFFCCMFVFVVPKPAKSTFFFSKMLHEWKGQCFTNIGYCIC